MPDADHLAARDIAHVRADNPGPFTLSGSNTWVLGRNPSWVIDPGPVQEAHVAAVAAEVNSRGGLGGILLTHDHVDHAGAVASLRDAAGDAPVAGARGDVDVLMVEGDTVGPIRALATPGHAPDHLAFLHEDVAFTGDAVLGEGSVFVAPDPGALIGYLAGLQQLLLAGPSLLCPGHGPLVTDPKAKLEGYIAHRLDRERRLVDALDRGLRSVDALLDDVWSDAAAPLRGAAAVTLRAHLDKLAEEGRLPDGVELPPWPRAGTRP
jgi:glyoxylase-like metal-dependent hydrolase (beta-lactamase superfamily II)